MPDTHGAWGSGPRQITSERVGGWSEIVVALRIGAVLAFLAGLVVVLVAASTVIAGPWSLVVLLPAGLVTVARWFEPEWDTHRYNLAAWGALVVLALAMLPDEAMRWWPWGWQASRASWWGLRWPAAWAHWRGVLVVRVVLVAAVWRAWGVTWDVSQRLLRELWTPTLSGATYNATDPAAVSIPGVVNPYQPPEPAPIVEVRPVQPVPFHTNGTLVRDVVRTASGAEIGKARLLAMLEAQESGVGFSWRVWHRRRWTRTEWETAMAALEELGLVTPRKPGQTTRLLGEWADAFDQVERL